MTPDEIIAVVDRPGFAWDNLPPEEQRNLLGSIEELMNIAHEEGRKTARICKVCKGTGKHRAHNWTANTKELRDCYACEAPSTKRKIR